MTDPLAVAVEALQRIVDDCPMCGGYGVRREIGGPCDRCEVARDALRDVKRAKEQPPKAAA